jgi:DNA anti-recombination protein RmuC
MGIPDFQKLDKWEDTNKTKVFLPQESFIKILNNNDHVIVVALYKQIVILTPT